MKIQKLLGMLLFISLLSTTMTLPILAQQTIPVTYYYSSSTTCGSCIRKNGIMDTVEQNYSGQIIVTWTDVDNSTNRTEANDIGINSFPAAYIAGETIVPTYNFTEESLQLAIEYHLSLLPPEEEDNGSILSTVPVEVYIAVAVVLIVVLGAVAVMVWKKEQ